MKMTRITSLMRKIFRLKSPAQHSDVDRSRGPQIHVIVLDGTMSSLQEGLETNAGQTYRLLEEVDPQISVFYEAGVQFTQWKNAPDVMMGKGINRQIRRAYGFLASRYRPGDKIFLFGYSRGAFAVRSLAGVIDRIGLLEGKHANVRNIRQAYRHYECSPNSTAARDFAKLYCHDRTEIEMIGVWDTVKALGVRLPLIWRWSEIKHRFHNHGLSPIVKHGFHALALNETRRAYAPVLWDSTNGWSGRVEQVWFKGTHGDVGGQMGDCQECRPLANIPLVWMLDRAESCGLPLPTGWRGRFPTDVDAPSVGSWAGWGKLFLLRGPRRVGRDPSERLHDSAQPAERVWAKLWPFSKQA